MRRLALLLVPLFIFLYPIASENIAAPITLEMHFNVAESNHDFRVFGLTASPSLRLTEQEEEVNLEIQDTGNSLHGSATVYAYWSVSSVESFELELSGTPLMNMGSIWNWRGVWDSEYDRSDEIMEISADDSYDSKLIYTHDPVNQGISSSGVVEINIETEDWDELNPGLYSGSITLGIKGE